MRYIQTLSYIKNKSILNCCEYKIKSSGTKSNNNLNVLNITPLPKKNRHKLN
jgi:hypothetical protein